jgi:hypothetical protein
MSPKRIGLALEAQGLVEKYLRLFHKSKEEVKHTHCTVCRFKFRKTRQRLNFRNACKHAVDDLNERIGYKTIERRYHEIAPNHKTGRIERGICMCHPVLGFYVKYSTSPIFKAVFNPIIAETCATHRVQERRRIHRHRRSA